MEDSYKKQILGLREEGKLHSAVEARLVGLLKKAFPDTAAIPEVSAVAGGRNDLLHYSFDGRRTVFEVFCSASQMSQDLRLLEQCDAAVKIAVLLDSDVDDRVSRQYFRKKPNAFPYLWLRQLMDKSWEAITVARLRELIEENHSVIRLRRLLEGPHRARIDQPMRAMIDRLESQLEGQPSTTPPLSNKQLIALQIVALIAKKGVPAERLRSLFHWLVDSVEYALEVISCGFQAFLVTDIESCHAVWSDADLADDLIICTPDAPQAQVVICLNPIINGFLAQHGQEPRELRFHFVHSYAEFADLGIPSLGIVKNQESETEEDQGSKPNE